jgi:uncharacterized protein involved in tolerance to divalent cations
MNKITENNCKEVDMEVNAEEIQYAVMSGHCRSKSQFAGCSKSLENVTQFKYWGTTVTHQNCIHEEIKSRLNSGNACCCSVQSLLSPRLMSKIVKIKIFKSINSHFRFMDDKFGSSH